jgi:hypothetical protein
MSLDKLFEVAATFAGQAMQGLMTDKMIRDTLSVEGLAIEAVEQARALLALLEKEPTGE